MTTPNLPRVYDLLLGGGDDATEADEAEAARIRAAFPWAAEMLAYQREFLKRAVIYLVKERRIRQILDLGSGLPFARERTLTFRDARCRERTVTLEGIHATAWRENGDATIAYVDSDPVVAAHTDIYLDDPRIAAVCSDARAVEAVLGDEALLEVIDLSEPVAVVMGCLLHFMTADEATTLVRGYADRVVPGSALAASVVRNDSSEGMRRAEQSVRSAAIWNHDPDQIRAFLAPFPLIPPGLVTAWSWRAGVNDARAVRPAYEAYALAAVGVLD